MSYECKVIADSISEAGKRLTTVVVSYPRSIHSEWLTHRMFSRSSASSRAIPVKKLMAQIVGDPALPIYWGSAKPGMQAGAELPPDVIDACRADILAHRDAAVALAARLEARGMHKQDANRYLEPWMYITVIVTATEWANFFKLRCDAAAHPSFRKIAEMTRDAMAASTPEFLWPGEWHCPYMDDSHTHGQPTLQERRIAVARCARVSYLTHDGEHDPAKDLELAGRLAAMGHWSPFEHVAQALDDPRERVGNLTGWRQYRADVDPDFIR
jgi:thymidylate synthase ThyX